MAKGFLRTLFGRWAQRARAPDDDFWYAPVAPENAAGVRLTDDTMLSATAVLCAVRNISESLAMLPLHVYRRDLTGARKKTRDMDHPNYPLLHDAPNPELTSFEWREMQQASLLVRGNAYSEIERNRRGDILALWPLRADRMKVRCLDNALVYLYRTETGEQIPLRSEQVLHVRGFCLDGLIGLALPKVAGDAVGLTVALERFGARLFSNGAMARGVMKTDKVMSEEAQTRLRTQLQKVYSGLDNAHRIAILEQGLEWQQMGINPEDAQALESRQFQVTEVARIFNIPPHRLMELTNATYSNIEHQGLEYVTYTLGPWLERWQQRLKKSLFTPEERATHYVEFLTAALVRGDIKTRYEAYAVGRQNGWLSADEVRDFENMNPIPDGTGGAYQLTPVGAVAPGKEPAPPPNIDGDAKT